MPLPVVSIPMSKFCYAKHAKSAQYSKQNMPLLTANSSSVLTEDDLNQVLSVLWCTRFMWFQLGLALLIDISTLEVIKRDNPHSTDDCFRSMVVTWLRGSNPIPCWNALAEALRSPSVRIQTVLKV